MKKILLLPSGILFLSFFLFSCVATLPQRQPEVIMSTTDFDKTWAAIIKTITVDYGIPIKTIEKDSGLLITDWIGFERPPKTMSEYIQVSQTKTFPSVMKFRFFITVTVSREDNIKITIRDTVQNWTSMDWVNSNEMPPAIESILNDIKKLSLDTK